MKAANGKEITLYYPDGTIIPNIEEFIDCYSKCYYLDNNKEVEDVIDNILDKGIQSPLELFRVLAWEFMKINMDKSKGNDFKYKGITNEKNMQLQIPYKKDIIYKSDIEKIYKPIEMYSGKCSTDDEAQSFLKELKTVTEGKHFYSVYMIALLYFVSNGRYPIVNSSSYVALEAIYNNTPFGTRKSYQGIAKRDTPEYEKIITEGNYADYRKKLKEIFGEQSEPRKVDQALWTYGKLFKK